MEKHGFVYLWFDRKHKRYYVGCHWGSETDGYVCSSRWMKLAKRRRPQDFKRRILKTGIATRKETYEEEQRWLQLIKESEIKTRYYNLNIRNNEIWLKYDENVKEISEKISINTKKAMQSPEVRKNYLKGLKKRNTKSSDPEVREKRRQSMRATMLSKHGHKWSAEKQLAFAAR